MRRLKHTCYFYLKIFTRTIDFYIYCVIIESSKEVRKQSNEGEQRYEKNSY